MTDNIPDEIMREARRIVSAIAIQKPNAYEAKAEIVALALLARDIAARKKCEASEKTRATTIRALEEQEHGR